jgi:phosphate transport system protein
MASEHTQKTYDEELTRLTNSIIAMGGLAESQLQAAIQAVATRDSDLASEVIENDARVDQLESEVEEQSIRLLALRQPMARDLREIVSALKISTDLERICDYAANVAKRAITLNHSAVIKPTSGIARMGRIAQVQVRNVLDAYVERDSQKAQEVWLGDEELDDVYTSLFRELLTYMMEDPRSISSATHLLFMAKNIERVGDHATNIAETIHYLIHGTPLREIRPKRDRSSSAVVLPGITGVIENPAEPKGNA